MGLPVAAEWVVTRGGSVPGARPEPEPEPEQEPEREPEPEREQEPGPGLPRCQPSR